MQRTALYDKHVELGAKIVDFAGWKMPMQYAGILKEHLAVRNGVGLFDVSHMGDILVTGDAAEGIMLKILTNNVKKAKPMDCIYTHILNDSGKIIDDMILTKFSNDRYFCVPNASMADVIFDWFVNNNENAVLENLSKDYVCLAVQGPKGAKVLQTISEHDLSSIKIFKGAVLELDGGRLGKKVNEPDLRLSRQCLVTRTGYTGEDGFELIAENKEGPALWDAIMEAGRQEYIQPIGLGARDTLRLEKGFLLSGQDFHGDRTPLETGWDFVVDWEHDFIGKGMLENQKAGPYAKLTALKMLDKAIPRHGSKVFHGGEEISVVTSGTMSPVLKTGIALAYLHKEHRVQGSELEIEIHGKRHPAQVVKAPFVPNKK